MAPTFTIEDIKEWLEYMEFALPNMASQYITDEDLGIEAFLRKRAEQSAGTDQAAAPSA